MNQHYFAVRCAPCCGSGLVNSHTPCTICKGEGAILLPGSVQNYRDCPNCAASGFKGFNLSAACTMCDGVGAVRNP